MYHQRIDAVMIHHTTPDEYLEPDEFRRFVSAPESQRLRSLGINGIYHDGRILRILLASPLAHQLRHLDLSEGTILNADDWSPLADAALANLEVLTLNNCRLGQAGLDAFCANPHWQGLRCLNFEAGSARYHGPALARALVATHLPRLEALNINCQQIGNEGLIALADWPGLARLRRLGLADQTLESERFDPLAGLRALIASPHWGELRELDLRDTMLTGDQLVEIVSSPRLASLRVLHLDFPGSDEPDDEARLLAECRFLADDLELHFPSGRLTPTGEQWLRDRFGDGLVLE